MKKLILVSLISLISTLGCKGSNIFGNETYVSLNSVPETFEKPSEDPDVPITTPTEEKKESTNPTTPTPTLPSERQQVPLEIVDSKPEAKKPAPKPNSPVVTTPVKPNAVTPTPLVTTKLEPSTFIQKAEYIMRTEGRKIGTPCNEFLARVLEIAGYVKAFFMANDFDNYAKKYFKHYRAVDFKNDRSGSEKTRLKQHLWSYPERTPFILQWSREGVHGHLGIVERVQDRLVIYQASLNSHSAQRDQTTVDILLNGYNRRTLTVYSEFAK